MGRRSKFEPLDGHKVTIEELLNGHDPDDLGGLFQKYIVPNLETVKSLTSFYTNDKQYVDEYYNHVLTQMYKYIYSYDPAKSLKTWIHIVTKRAVQHLNKQLHTHVSHSTGIVYNFDSGNGEDEDVLACGGVDEGIMNDLMSDLSDEVLMALRNTPPNLLSAFLLYVQGYPYEEIVEIERERGYVDKDPEEALKIIKNRIYLAKKTLKNILKENGITNACTS